jgi:hypothetical protein
MSSSSVVGRGAAALERRVLMPRIGGALLLLRALSACGSDGFDASQVPVVSATTNPAFPVATFTFRPDSAQQLRVYRGTVTDVGVPDSLVWSIVSAARNGIVSGIEYGRSGLTGVTVLLPARPLIAGRTYTVEVARADPGGAGTLVSPDSRYVGRATFVIPTTVVNAAVRPSTIP